MTWLLLLVPGMGLLFHSLLGFLFFAPVYGVKDWWWNGFTIELVTKRKPWGLGKNGGCQTHGIFKMWTENRINDEPLRKHEDTHIFDEFWFGFIFIITYILSWFVNFPLCALFGWFKHETKDYKRPLWRRAYLAIPWEIRARRVEERARA